MKILLSSYSFGAGCGSEPGVGWNIARGLALRGHEVTVVTTPRLSEQNHAAIEAEHLPIRLIEVLFGDQSTRFRSKYYKWQKKIAPVIRRESEEGRYDVVHHLTFNQYRGIRDVFDAGLPFLIGPVGGAELIPPYLLLHGKMPLTMLVKELLRYVPWDAVPVICRTNAASVSHAYIASNPISAERMNRGLVHLKQPASVHPIIAVNEEDIVPDEPDRPQPYFLFDGGLSRPQKGTWLMLDALAMAWQKGCRVPVRMVGTTENDHQVIFRYAKRIGLPQEAVALLPRVAHNEMLMLMRHSTALLSTVYRDSGGMAILEALAQGTNVVCFDIPSQQWLPKEMARKVAVPSLFAGRGVAARSVADALQQVVASPSHGEEWHRQRCAFLHEQMTWEAHVSMIEKAYSALSPLSCSTANS